MSEQILKDALRNRFRPKLFVENIAQLENYDPAFEYKQVIFTFKHDPSRIQRYLDNGWEIVETLQSTQDDRAFTPNKKDDEKLRPQPVVTTTRDGHQQVLMKCLKTRRAENELAKCKNREDLQQKDLKLRGASQTRRGNEIITQEAEINENSTFN